MKELTTMEMLERLEWRREIRNLMGRISHDYAVKQEAAVYARYWSTRDDVCLGLNNGWYQGAAAVKGYYDALGEEIRLSSKLITAMFPSELGDKTEEQLYGVGMISYVPFESQIIEIADDGKTAKGLWNVRGATSHLTAGGPEARWIFGWAAVDFVLEDEEWKIWHMQLLFNVDHQSGSNFVDTETVYDPVPGFEAIADFRLPEPNVPAVLFETYRADRPAVKSPKAPVPYASFGETFSYGI